MMKVGDIDQNGPVLSVWKSLKGLSSRDLCSPGSLSSPIDEGKMMTSSGPERLARVDSCPTEVIPSNEPYTIQKDCHIRSFSEVGQPVETNLLQRISWGVSSSTTSTSLSNPNLALRSNSIYGTSILNSVHSSNKDHTKDLLALVKDEDDLEEDDENAHVFRYRHTRINSKKMRRRVVQKTGECNVTQSNVSKRRKRYLQDIFTTLVDMQWRWTLLVFAMSFLMSWLLFAFAWYGSAFMHGDLLEKHLPNKQSENGWTPCITNVYGFTSCFLFSVETQTTIGYGYRYATEECPEAICTMCIQSIAGVMIQAFMVGVVFAKLSRPKKRTQTLMFSRNACICQRDGDLCLIFRVGDMRKSHIIEAHIRAQLIRKKITKEGEIIPYFQYELNVGYDVGGDRIFFIWPMTIVHIIDESSPLYDVSAHDLLREKFEIVVMLEGVIESTGMTTQARSSYLPTEVLWGYRFEPLVFFDKDSGEHAVDYSLFNNMQQVSTPLCSARHLHECGSGESTPVSPVTPSTPLSPLTPITPPVLDFESGLHRSGSLDVSTSSALSNTLKYNDARRNPHQTHRNALSQSSSSSTLKAIATTASSNQEDGDTITERFPSLSEVVVSQPLFSPSSPV